MNARTEFKMEPAEHVGLRRAALALHATEGDDQAWLLAQLPVDHQPVLTKMLADLATLGLPRDRKIVEELLRASSAPRKTGPGRPVVATKPDLESLRLATAADLAFILEPEPPELVAHVCALLPIATRAQALDLLSAPKRRRVQEALASRGYASAPGDGNLDAAPRLTQAVVKELLTRLPRRSSPVTGWQGLRVRLKAALPSRTV